MAPAGAVMRAALASGFTRDILIVADKIKKPQAI
jgi:hypothetical protein